MPYTNGDGVSHDRRTCRRLHNTSGRIRRIDAVGDRDPCPHCADGSDAIHERDVEQLVDAGVCPWCDAYSGDHVGQHASSAHPKKWAAYRDG